VLQQLASTNQNNDQPVVAAGVFRPIDTARIARELKIEAVARDRGGHNLPETGDNNLDALERKIIQTIDGERAWQGRELLNSLRAYAAQLVSYSVPEEFPKLQIHAKHALASLSVAAGRAPNDLLPLQKRYVAARDALEEFRSRNRLSRSARDPARGWSTLGLLFIFGAMESMLTGFFFTNGREFGLVDAIRMAVEISLMNVAFSFLLGLGPCRWRNHRRSFVSTSGLFVTLAGIAFIVALHLFAAHLRVATPLGGEGRAFASILGSIQRVFWARPDMASFCLLGMSLVIAFGAIWKGYVFDDPYPRYGTTHRRAKSAREQYQRAHCDLFDELSEIEEDSVRSAQCGHCELTRISTDGYRCAC
jgi:hypothetical protein